MKSNDENSMNKPSKRSRQSAEEAFNESLQQLRALLKNEESQKKSQPPQAENPQDTSNFTADEWEDAAADLENFLNDSEEST